MQASKLVADWSMRWSRDTLLKKLHLYLRKKNAKMKPLIMQVIAVWNYQTGNSKSVAILDMY